MNNKFFDFLVKHRKIITPVSLVLSVVCFSIFAALLVFDIDNVYIPLLVMFVVSTPNKFYLFIDELDEEDK